MTRSKTFLFSAVAVLAAVLVFNVGCNGTSESSMMKEEGSMMQDNMKGDSMMQDNMKGDSKMQDGMMQGDAMMKDDKKM